MAQSGWIKEKIEQQYPDLQVELVRIKTKGDKILNSPLSKIGGKGLFVKEIEDALLSKDIDLAVHSIKDVPAELPEGLCLPIFPEREDPRDAFLSIEHKSIADMPEGATIGTGSLRRSSQLRHLRPDLDIVSIRGNVDTRLKKMEKRELEAIILASAGLRRLGLSDKIRQLLPSDEFIPAIGQGALGIELRRDDDRIYNLLGFLNHEPTELTVKAERAFLEKLEGGCQVPIGGNGRLQGENIILDGMVAELDGSRIIRDEVKGSKDQPIDIGYALAEKLLISGADEILKRIYGQ